MSERDDQNETDDQQEAPLTRGEVTKIVNAALSSQLKRLKLNDMISAAVTDAIAKASPAQTDDELSPEMREKIAVSERKLAELESAHAESQRRQRDAEERAARVETERELNELCASVKPGLRKYLVNDLMAKVQRDDDGGLLIDDLPAADAVKAFPGTAEGKEILPMRDVRGSGNMSLGNRGGSARATGGKDEIMSDAELGSALARMF